MPLYRKGYRRTTVAIGLVFCFVPLLAGAAAGPELGLQISSEAVPAGGWAQIKVFATAPGSVAAGAIAMDLDPAVFGCIASVAVFSATGDALGYANVNGQHVDAHFSSPSAGIGQLPGLPVFAVWVPVLPGAKVGTSTAMKLDASGGTWTDAQGNAFEVTATASSLTVGGGLSVASVTPGGGLLPAGTVLGIAGTGFDATTTVAIDGAAVASLRFVNPQRLEAVLGGATELTGKRFRLANGDGQMVDYFSAFPSAPTGDMVLPGIHPLVPLNLFTSVTTDSNLLYHPASHRRLAMLNQNLTPVTVLRAPVYGTYTAESFEIPPGTLDFRWPGEGYQITASAPIRMVEILQIVKLQGDSTTTTLNVFTPVVALAPPLPLQTSLWPTDVSWTWQAGTPAPAARTINIVGDLNLSITTSASWLSVTSTQSTLTLKPNPAQLAPGVYSATVSLTPMLPAGLPTYPVRTVEVTVSLTVSAAPLISASTLYIVLSQATPGGPVTGGNTLSLSSNGLPATFTTAATTSFSGPWLSVAPSSGTTPATLSVTANPAGMVAGTYLGDLAVQGPANTLHVTVFFYVQPPGESLTAETRPYFILSAGATAPAQAQQIRVGPAGASIQVAVQTANGGDWLTAEVVANAPDPAVVAVSASAAKLTPGTYQGLVTISSTTLGAIQIPATLMVFSTQTAPTVTPSSLALTGAVGGTVLGTLAVTSAGESALFAVSSPTAWLQATQGESPTPGSVQVSASASQPGIYQGEVLVTWAKGTIHVPVTYTVTLYPPPPPPEITAILNAGSEVTGPLAPGEILTLFGLYMAPAAAGLQLDASGKVAATLNGTQVTVNDVAAPLVYVSPGQLNAIVPYEAGTSGTARIRVTSSGAASGAWDVPLGRATPAIFTIGSSGVGQGAVLNQDSSVNGAGNAAARGTVIQIFGTGEGQTSPPGHTGTVTGAAGGAPVLQVQVTIGGIDAGLQFAGAALGAVAGLFQANAVVPQGAPSGTAVPIVLSVGGVPSQRGVTIAVR